MKKKLLNSTEMDKILDRLAFQIIETCQDLSNTVLVGIYRRGVILAGRIRDLVKKHTGADLSSGTIDITLYRDDLQEIADFPKVYTTDLPDINGRIVIIVDDVVFTGRTARAALEVITDFGRPARIVYVAFIDRGHRELPIQPDFIGNIITTARNENVHVNVKEIDGEDSVTLDSKE